RLRTATLQLVFCMKLYHSFIATLSFALLDLGFLPTSSAEGRTGLRVSILSSGFFPHMHAGNDGGHSHGFSRLWNSVFTILSSSEWKVIIASLPPGLSSDTALSTASFRAPSSSFTA